MSYPVWQNSTKNNAMKTNLTNLLCGLFPILLIAVLAVQFRQQDRLAALQRQQQVFSSAASQQQQEHRDAGAKLASQMTNLGASLESRLTQNEHYTKEKAAEIPNIVQQQRRSNFSSVNLFFI